MEAMAAGRAPPALACLLLASSVAVAAGSACENAATCQAHVGGLIDRLGEVKGEMRKKQSTLSVLEDLRFGALTGKRVELPSAQRQHLERGEAPISEVTFDARHRPISTNASRHFKPLATVADDSEVQHHAFLTLKKSSSSKGGGASTLLVVVDSMSTLSVYNFQGEALLRNFDLGHGAGRQIVHMALSPGDAHSVLTADDSDTVRVHDLKIVAQKEQGSSKRDGAEGKENPAKRAMKVSSNFSCSFTVPEGGAGEARRLTTVQPVDRGSQPWFVAGDSAGGLSVFYRNGTLKGRVKVTEDPGGVRGLMRGSGQIVIYWSSHSFGYFSAMQVEVQYPPCTGWNSPLFDVALDPTSTGSRVVLALSDGDVIIYTTSSGKSKSCDLTLKFPHVSSVPFKLHTFRGHVMGLPSPTAGSTKANVLQDIFVFNVAAMDSGYGLAPSRALALQASFKPKSPVSMALAAGTSQDRSKGQAAIRYDGVKGVELFEINLKQPPAKAAAGGGDAGGGDSWVSWLEWFPKVGVFGIALIGVVFWNVRKVNANQQKSSRSGMDDFDEDGFRERLRERRELQKTQRAAKEGMGGDGGASGGGARGSGAQEVDSED